MLHNARFDRRPSAPRRDERPHARNPAAGSRDGALHGIVFAVPPAMLLWAIIVICIWRALDA